VLEAAKVMLKPEQLVTVVVGNMAQIDPSLDSLGAQIVPLDVTITDPVGI